MKHNTPAQEVKSLETLFFTFFKIGLFTFGGGYAMIALLEEEFIQDLLGTSPDGRLYCRQQAVERPAEKSRIR